MVESPTIPSINSQYLTSLLSQFDFLHGKPFDTIFEGVEMGQLHLILPEFLDSKNFSLLYNNGK